MRHFHLEWDLSTDRIVLEPGQPELVREAGGVSWQDWLARMRPDDRERCRRVLGALTPGQPAYRIEYRLTGADGAEYPLEERGVGRFAADGRLRQRSAIVAGVDDRLPGAPADGLPRAAGAELLRRVLEASLAGLYVFDFALGRNVYVSPRYAALTGYSLDDLARFEPQAFLERFHPDDRARVLQHWERMRNAGAAALVEIEYRFRHRDGRWVWFRSADSVLQTDPDGTARSVLGTFIDISDLKETVAALERSDSRAHDQLAEIEQIYASAPVGLCVLDRELRFVRINARLAEINGVPVDAHLGRRVREVVPQIAEHFEARMMQVIEQGEAVLDLEVFGETAAQPGVQRTWIESWLPMRDAHGTVIGINVVAREVTAERALRREQAEQQALLQALFDNAAVGIAQVGLDGRFLHSNRRLTEITGYSNEELAGLRFQDITHPEDLEADLAQSKRLWSGEIAEFQMEKRYIRKDGSPVWVKLTGSAVRDSEGTASRFVAVIDDIREKKLQEAALRDANRRKDEFLAVMGHELRNPMAPIRNALDILLLKADRSDPDMDRTLQILDRQASHLGRLLDDLLDISRIERGQLELDLQPVSVSSLMCEAADDVRSIMGTRGHRFEIDLPDGTVQVEGDRVRLVQVLLNLLLNAAHYTPPGGRVRLSAAARNDAVTVEVSDTGPGLTPELRERLFVPFARGLSNRDGHSGLGLGLAICRQLVELHGGTLDADSAGPGEGSVFRLTLARRAGTGIESRPCSEQAAVAGSGGAPRVLLVEDNQDVAEALSMLLSALGWPAVVAGTGSEALALTAEWRPRLALLDIGLPDMAGTELARRLRGRHPDASAMYLVAVTGFGHSEAHERILEAGFDQHLTKPVDCATLQRLLAELG